MKKLTKVQLIAPCGMNCGICAAYLREKNKCPGCNSENTIDKPSSCQNCIIKNCLELKKLNLKYCSDKCQKFPCLRLKNLDKRYRTKYKMSMIENLSNISQDGIRKFVKNEEKRWKCESCGGVVCVHKGRCFNCKN